MNEDNPFFHRSPIRDPAYFWNRELETRGALGLLCKGQSVSFVGPRRIGKTSLLLHILDPTTHSQFNVDSDRLCLVLINCESWGRLESTAFYELLLEHLERAIRGMGRRLVLPSRSAAPTSYVTFERASRAVMDQHVQLVFVFDEFEILSANPQLTVDFFSSLRGLATSHNVAFVTVSTKPLLAITDAADSVLSSPFFNIFHQIQVGLFHETDALAMLTGLTGMGKKTFAASTLRLLLDLAGPHPFLLHIGAFHAFERVDVNGALDDASRTHVQRLFLEEAEAHWSYAWRNLAADDQRVLALLPVLGSSSPESIRRLTQAGLVRTSDADTVVPLSLAFQQFVRQQAVSGLRQVPPITIDPAQRIVLLHGQPLSLALSEFALLDCLLEHPHQLVVPEQIKARLWPAEADKHPHVSPDDDMRIRATVRELRAKLGPNHDCIENVRGVGYRFVPAR